MSTNNNTPPVAAGKAKLKSTTVILGAVVAGVLATVAFLIVHNIKTGEYEERLRANPKLSEEPPRMFLILSYIMLAALAVGTMVGAVMSMRRS